MKKRWAGYTLAAAVLAVGLAGSVQADTADLKAEEYLREYYHIAPFSMEDADLDAINAALTALGGNALPGDEIDHEAIIAEGIRIAGLEELALSYRNDANPDKAAEVLEREGIEMESEEYAPYVACAYDLGLLGADEGERTKAEDYLYRCAEIGGKGRRYIGRISDDDILTVMQTALNELSLFGEDSMSEALSETGKDLVLSGVTTGYSLKYANYDSHFLADYTIRYGHADYQHAIQLAGLLKSEGMDAYIQIEPKVSVYEYLTSWGDPGEPSPTHTVYEAEEGRYLFNGIEYDLLLEFDSREDKEAFHQLIEDYAKKYDDRVDEEEHVIVPLLAESWWQPLYYSATEMENKEYEELVENVVYDENGLFSIHTITLPEDSAAVMEKVKEDAPELETGVVTVYANPAFARYLTGEDHQ